MLIRWDVNFQVLDLVRFFLARFGWALKSRWLEENWYFRNAIDNQNKWRRSQTVFERFPSIRTVWRVCDPIEVCVCVCDGRKTVVWWRSLTLLFYRFVYSFDAVSVDHLVEIRRKLNRLRRLSIRLTERRVRNVCGTYRSGCDWPQFDGKLLVFHNRHYCRRRRRCAVIREQMNYKINRLMGMAFSKH